MTESEYRVLKRKAWEHRRMASLALEDKLEEQAIANFHLAIEILMKAVLSKEDLSFPRTHDLAAITDVRGPGDVKLLRDAINADSVIRPMWDTIRSVWSPSKRYEIGPEQEDYSDIFDAYERVYEWIENKFF